MTPTPDLVLDVRALQSEHAGRGIGRYVANHAIALDAETGGGISTFVLRRDRPVPDALRHAHRERLTLVRGDPSRVLRYAPTVLHAMSPFESMPWSWMWPRAARRRDAALVATAYDLIPLVFAEHYLKEPRMRRAYEVHCGIVKAADAVVAISQSTAEDVHRLLAVPEKRIHVIGSGVSPEFHAKRSDVATRHVPSVPGLTDPFVLYVGGVDFRKNLEGALAGFARLPAVMRDSHQFVIACSVNDSTRMVLEAHAAALGVSDRVLFTGFVPDEVLVDLYATCATFIFPSLYEGFGLPVAEAMLQGAVVIVGRNSSLRELVPGDEFTFDPADANDMARVLARALDDHAFRARAREHAAGAQFDWADVARRTLPAYEAARAAISRRVRSRRRLALVTPYPPDVSGIAEHSRALATKLAEAFAVDIVADSAESQLEQAPPGGRILSTRGFPASHDVCRYDRVIYAMGNSHFHSVSLDALRRTGGDVLLHDAWLNGLYFWRSTHGGVPLAAELQRMYGARLPAELAHAEWITDADARRLDVRMLADVIDAADRIWVHSRTAADAVRRDAGRAGLDAPDVRLLPFWFPEPAAGMTPPGPRLDVVSLGIVSPGKGPRLLVEALAVLRASGSDARALFVGPIDAALRAELEGAAASLGVPEHVVFTGEVGAAEYQQRLEQASVAVQLRLTTSGEASLTVAEAMSHGIPCVVSDSGWFSELPDEAVVKVPVGCRAQVIADAIASVAHGTARRRDVVAAARGYAAAHSAARVARLLVAP